MSFITLHHTHRTPRTHRAPRRPADHRPRAPRTPSYEETQGESRNALFLGGIVVVALFVALVWVGLF